MVETELVALLMAGGSGTRFWPLSQKSFPKQYLALFGKQSLIQETLSRLSPLVPSSQTFICSGQNQEAILKSQVPQIEHLILEPEGKNTAPCLMLSALVIKRLNYSDSTPLLVLPSDHFIGEPEIFRKAVEKAAAFAKESGRLITLGIRPDSPHTGYGYIESGPELTPLHQGFCAVKRFVEKPSLETAKNFLRQGCFFWNSGIFVWTLGAIIHAFETYLPTEWAALQKYSSAEDLKALYSQLPSISIDVAVLEKAANLAVLPVTFPWSDIGSWNALYQLQKRSAEETIVLSGEVRKLETSGCLVHVPAEKRVALVGCQDLVIVEKEGVLLIAHRDCDQKVREISKAFD